MRDVFTREWVRFSLALAVGATLLALPAAAPAATIPVDTFVDDAISAADDNDCSLREAIESANTNTAIDDCTSGDPTATNPDTVELPSTGTYLLVNANDADDLNETGDLDVQASTATGGPLTIDGTAAGVVIDAQGSDRVIHHLSGNLTLSDLTVTGGSRFLGNGGGILSVGADLSLIDAIVTDNEITFGDRGGGVLFTPASTGTLTVTDSEVSDNTNNVNNTGNVGGGIAVGANGDLVMTGSTVTGNDISENAADGSTHGGGGVWAGGSSPPEITDSTISGNTVTAGPAMATTATPQGGGVLFESTGGSVIRDTTISGNQVIDSRADLGLNPGGGGVAITGTGAAAEYSIVNSTIASNSVAGDGPGGNWGGGGLFASPNIAQTVRVTHSTLAENESPKGDAVGSGFFGTVILKNSVFDDQDGDVTDTCDTSGTSLISAGHNVAMGTTCVDGVDDPTDLDSTDPLLEALGSFGGLTQTAVPGVASPAIDLVPYPGSCDDGAAVPATLIVDQRGFPRPFDGDGDSTADCDAGAAEVYPCFGANATNVGTAGADVINGTAAADVIHGADGADTITGGAGADKVCGGAGDDNLQLADGVADQGDCGAGTDSFLADNSLDTLIACETDLSPPPPPGPGPGPTPTPPGSCGGKTATKTGTAGSEVITGTPGRDVIDAKGGNDKVRGLGGKDLICGKAGKDRLIGGAGNDTLNGGPGRDLLKGGPGRDRLLGKGGRDRCIGGGGRDRGKSCERRAGIP